MEPELADSEFVFCTLPSHQVALLDLEPVGRFREAEGETLIVPRLEAERCKLSFIYPCRMITLKVHSSLEAVGFLAAITTKLATAGISVNPVSAYYHDYLFVSADKAEQAMDLLAEFHA
jgi:hypothetical protein